LGPSYFTHFVKKFIPSYTFGALSCQNWPFPNPNPGTLQRRCMRLAVEISMRGTREIRGPICEWAWMAVGALEGNLPCLCSCNILHIPNCVTRQNHNQIYNCMGLLHST
jgi:hypothetical protein